MFFKYQIKRLVIRKLRAKAQIEYQEFQHAEGPCVDCGETFARKFALELSCTICRGFWFSNCKNGVKDGTIERVKTLCREHGEAIRSLEAKAGGA